jgi:hypothetical protein
LAVFLLAQFWLLPAAGSGDFFLTLYSPAYPLLSPSCLFFSDLRYIPLAILAGGLGSPSTIGGVHY